MPPRQRQQKESLRDFFDRILRAFRTLNVPRESTQQLATLRGPLLTPAVPTKAATEFDIHQAVFAFGLVPEGIDEVFDELPNVGESLRWRIEDIPETQDFIISPCLRKSFKHSHLTVD
jgi:hypothetical protein